jgi:hypothetical protein
MPKPSCIALGGRRPGFSFELSRTMAATFLSHQAVGGRQSIPSSVAAGLHRPRQHEICAITSGEGFGVCHQSHLLLCKPVNLSPGSNRESELYLAGRAAVRLFVGQSNRIYTDATAP